MPTTPDESLASDTAGADRCYDCFRRRDECFCAAIPEIENKTEVLILQHVRERFHPFNTARIVHKSLKNSTLLVKPNRQLAAERLPLRPRAGLLYPAPDAMLLSDLDPSEHPEQLVIVDGTWHQAKTLVRDISALHDLPRYQLAPSSPGRYRIRREPTDTTLSTLEATVAALRALEPDTEGLDQLLGAFEAMVDQQLVHAKSKLGPRRRRRGLRTSMNIPRAIAGDLGNVVVAYGESEAGRRGDKHSGRTPVYWVAQRLGTNESFRCTIRPESTLEDAFLGHLELTEQDFVDASSPDAFRESWRAFVRPSDTLTVYCQSTANLLKHVGGAFSPYHVLKSIDFPGRRYRTLDDLLLGEELTPSESRHPGRAGKRLANAVALVRHLNALGHA